MITLELTDDILKSLLHNAYTAWLEGNWVYGNDNEDILLSDFFDHWQNYIDEAKITILGKNVILIDNKDL